MCGDGTYDSKAKTAGFSTDVMFQEGLPSYTECAHIVPESIYLNVEADKKVRLQYSTAANDSELMLTPEALFCFDVGSLEYDVENLNGDRVHSLYNLMSMRRDIHDSFNRLDLWFEETVSSITRVHDLCLFNSTYLTTLYPRTS